MEQSIAASCSCKSSQGNPAHGGITAACTACSSWEFGTLRCIPPASPAWSLWDWKGQPLGANFAAGRGLWDLHRQICRKTSFPFAPRRWSLPLAMVSPVKSSWLQGLSGKAIQLPGKEETFQTYWELFSPTSSTFLPPPTPASHFWNWKRENQDRFLGRPELPSMPGTAGCSPVFSQVC